MKVESFSIIPFKIPLESRARKGFLVEVEMEGKKGMGEVSPLPSFSKETEHEAFLQLKSLEDFIKKREWTLFNWKENLQELSLYPSVSFGVETALLSVLDPLLPYEAPLSALLMGSFEEILFQAEKREKEGYISAKLKVSNLSFKEAKNLILRLQERFKLRIDVNQAWEKKEALDFFADFPLDAFEYVEEPFKNPLDLKFFTHPVAVDESFPERLSFKDLEEIPFLKAVIYKPTLQGGLLGCLPLYEWLKKKSGVEMVLSSSFEGDVGLFAVSSLASRLKLKSAIGIGTYAYFQRKSSF